MRKRFLRIWNDFKRSTVGYLKMAPRIPDQLWLCHPPVCASSLTYFFVFMNFALLVCLLYCCNFPRAHISHLLDLLAYFQTLLWAPSRSKFGLKKNNSKIEDDERELILVNITWTLLPPHHQGRIQVLEVGSSQQLYKKLRIISN